MSVLDLVKLTPLMELTDGRPEIGIGLIDGPVVIDHPDLARDRIREVPGRLNSACALADSAACMHGTFVAGILCGKRESMAPAICPGCTLLVRTVFSETAGTNGQMPSATPEDLAAAVIDTIEAGARVLNLSLAQAQPSSQGQRALKEAFDYAARRGVIVVVAAGNQGTIGSSAIIRHPWVIPVVAYDLGKKPIAQSNLGRSIGGRGLGAPGDNIRSLGANNRMLTFAGTSAATPFVTGAIALLWSEFPSVTAAELKSAITQAHSSRRARIVPPLLDAWSAYQTLQKVYRSG